VVGSRAEDELTSLHDGAHDGQSAEFQLLSGRECHPSGCRDMDMMAFDHVVHRHERVEKVIRCV
jgi:hypothetical protein